MASTTSKSNSKSNPKKNSSGTPSYTLREGHFPGTHGSELFFQEWVPAQSKGTVLITHGLAEHTECYESLASVIAQNSWRAVAWDMRGHGRSEGKRGCVEDIHDLVTDLKFCIQNLESERKFDSSNPLVLFGHSLGGLITLKCAIEYSGLPIHGLMLSSPLLDFAIKVPVWKQRAAQFLAQWAPTLTMWNEVRFEDLTRDAEAIKSFDKDPLRHDRISSRLYLGMSKTFQEVQVRAAEISLPFLLMVAGDDRIVSAKAAIDFFERTNSPKKFLKIFEESRHEILNDFDREQMLKDVAQFLGDL